MYNNTEHASSYNCYVQAGIPVLGSWDVKVPIKLFPCHSPNAVQATQTCSELSLPRKRCTISVWALASSWLDISFDIGLSGTFRRSDPPIDVPNPRTFSALTLEPLTTERDIHLRFFHYFKLSRLRNMTPTWYTCMMY